MKKIICLVLCALAALLACACGSDKTAAPTQAPPATEAPQTEALTETLTEAQTEASTENGDAISLKSFIAGFDTEPAVEEKQIYHDEKLTVTALGVDYTAISGPGIQLKLESSYDLDVIVQSPYAVVNGYMVSPEMSVELPAGKTAEGTLTVPYFNLAISGITSLKDIEFALRIVEAKSYEPITKTGLIAVGTSSKQKTDDSCDESGQTAYDTDGVKIVLKGVNTDRAYSDGAELIVYMVNSTDNNIAVRTNDVIVNGYDMTSAMNRTVLPGKRAVDVVTFYTLDMQEYGIDVIDSVKVSFEIKDAESWETIGSTDLISVTLKEAATEPVTETNE